MYLVSGKFLNAINKNTRTYYYSGKITTIHGREYSFTNEQILKGSGYITNQCCGNNEIEIGSVYSSELGITLIMDIDRYSLINAVIELNFHLEIEPNIYESIPMGKFEISEANRTSRFLEIKAYDFMLRFDKEYSFETTNGLAYDFLEFASLDCNVELAQTRSEFEKMLNTNILIGIYPDNDIQTYRDLIYYIAQVLGAFATINREGKLEFRKYKSTSNFSINTNQRFNSSFSDFITKYTAVKYTNIKDNKIEYYSLETDDGNTLDLGTNPFIQFGLKETRDEVLNNILTEISNINYVPFDSDVIGNPALDIGDIITFSGGQADSDKLSVITQITHKINGKQSIKGVGKNPRLSTAKSKNDKNLTGLLNQIESGKIITNTFTNIRDITISENLSTIISSEFASNKDTNALFNAAILLNVESSKISETIIGNVVADEVESETEILSEDTTIESTIPQPQTISFTIDKEQDTLVEIIYEMNDEEIATHTPKQVYKSGDQILNLFYPLNELKANNYNKFKVKMKATNGSVTISKGGIVSTISGQGLSANKMWDGRFELTESIEMLDFNCGDKLINLVEDISLDRKTPLSNIINDTLSELRFNGLNLYNLDENIAFNEKHLKETIDTSDKDKMVYNTHLIGTTNGFRLKNQYEYISHQVEIDRGVLIKVSTDTSEFEVINSIEIEIIN